MSVIRENKVRAAVEDLLDSKGMPSRVYVPFDVRHSKHGKGYVHPRNRAQASIAARSSYPFDVILILDGNGENTLGVTSLINRGEATADHAPIIGEIDFTRRPLSSEGLVIMFDGELDVMLGIVNLYEGKFDMVEDTSKAIESTDDATEAARRPKEIRPINGSFDTVEDLRRALEVGKFKRQ